jgi:hypothetical protein
MTQEKDINYWKNNCEEDYITTPISVLRYVSELEKLVTLPQQEISDEEIALQAYKYEQYEFYGAGTAFEQGAKWYREQLKQIK